MHDLQAVVGTATQTSAEDTLANAAATMALVRYRPLRLRLLDSSVESDSTPPRIDHRANDSTRLESATRRAVVPSFRPSERKSIRAPAAHVIALTRPPAWLILRVTTLLACPVSDAQRDGGRNPRNAKPTRDNDDDDGEDTIIHTTKDKSRAAEDGDGDSTLRDLTSDTTYRD